MIQKMLLCTDGSECAVKAARFAAEIAAQLKAEVVLVSIFCPPVGSLLWTHETLPSDLDDVLATGETVRTALTKLSAAALTDAGVTFRSIVETGDPVQQIVEIAGRERVDLVVVGSRGLGGFSSLLLGSISDSIAHHAPCPVLIVR